MSLAAIIAVAYLTAGIISEFVHDHEFDGSYHDDCIACQWNQLHQDYSSGLVDFIKAFCDPLQLVGFREFLEIPVSVAECCVINFWSRAPPQST